MTVLVVTASKHGSTAELAQGMAEAMRAHGVEVEVARVEDVSSVDGYDGVVLGSAVYMGRWLEAARQFVTTHATALGQRPVWLFSSGPVGDPTLHDVAGDVPAIIDQTQARQHRIFAGRLDKNELNLAEAVVVKAVRAPEGDYRDWAAVRAWAGRIADTLRADQRA